MSDLQYRKVRHGRGIALAFVLALTPVGLAQAASFNCATARAADETAICADRGLSEQDVRMDTLYGVLTHLVAMGQRGALQDEQREWLVQRARCGADTVCLRAAYDSRIEALQHALQDIYSRGPY